MTPSCYITQCDHLAPYTYTVRAVTQCMTLLQLYSDTKVAGEFELQNNHPVIRLPSVTNITPMIASPWSHRKDGRVTYRESHFITVGAHQCADG